jgi:hypothetical protein
VALDLELERPTVSLQSHGSLLSVCPHPGCATLTMGGTCVEHDVPARIVFPRGRPYVPAGRDDLPFAAIEQAAD